ncbi:MAG: hypothetical protein IE931_07305 [Sphingobacteriales bacterium]|nr:hypothetical protein [Sphingobacteriales bacterium]
MKERILTNWTFSRIIYLVLGVVLIIQFSINKQWFGVAFGAYFASMGLFAFGCASGNCASGNCETRLPRKMNMNRQIAPEEETK